MNFLNIKKVNNKTEIIITRQLASMLDKIKIGDKEVIYYYSSYSENEILLQFEEIKDFLLNTFLEIVLLDKDNNKIDVDIERKGIFPIEIYNDFHAILVKGNEKLVIKFVNLNDIIFKLERYKINSTLNVIGHNTTHYLIKLNKDESYQLNDLIFLFKEEKDQSYNYKISPIYMYDTHFLLPKEYISESYLLLLINSTVFQIEINPSMINDYVNNKSPIEVEDDNYENYAITMQKDKVISQLNTSVIDQIESVREVEMANIEVRNQTLICDLNEFDQNIINTEFPVLFMQRKNDDKEYLIPGEVIGDELAFNFHDFLNYFENRKESWNVYLLGKGNNIAHQIKLNGEISNQPNRYFTIFNQLFRNDSTYNCSSRLYLTEENTLALVKNNNSNHIKKQFSIKQRITDFAMHRSKSNLTIEIKSPYIDQLKVKSLYLVHRNKDGLDKRELEIRKVIHLEDTFRINSSFNLEEQKLHPLYWDFFLGIIVDEQEYLIKLTNVAEDIRKKVEKRVIRYQLPIDNTNIIYPYITINKELSFTYREKEYFETLYYYMKENIAYIVALLFSRYLKKKEIWIGFEKLALSAHESGYYFFDYVYRNEKHSNFYYVIRKDSPEFENLINKKDKVLYFMSFKYFVYMFSARLLISSDTKRNSYNLKMKNTRLGRELTNKPLVYLQHGVNGLKVVPDFYKNRGVFDLVIAPSDFEKKMIIEHWGYNESEVVSTGLARWDVLRDKTDTINYRQIFVMPTWRTWMDGMSKEEFLQSDYYSNYMSLLDSERLSKILEDNNIYISFFLHPKFKAYIELFNFKSNRIKKFDFLDVPLDEMIMSSSMMISDYSSVIWEMFYLGKPCLFYHFDREKYLEYEGSYLDFEQDLFGDVAFNPNDLINCIQSYIDNGFKEKDEFSELRNKYFNYMDNQNAARIYRAVEENKEMLYKKSKNKTWKLSHILPFKLRRKILNLRDRLFN